MLGNFHAFVVVCRLISNLAFSKYSFRDIIRVSTDSDPDQENVCPDPGLNCLQGYQQTTKVAASKKRVRELEHNKVAHRTYHHNN